MNFTEYQERAKETAIYPKGIYLGINDITHSNLSWIYPLVGLSGEIGELSNKLKKVIRDQYGQIHIICSKYDEIDLLILGEELGDILWYISSLATELELSLDEIAIDNIEKLKYRKKNNKIQGSGDKR